MTAPPVDLTDLGPLYHDFSFFGARNEQLPGHYAANQRAKAPILTAYIALAAADVLETASRFTFAELFCADAYYAMVASRLGATSSLGLDNERDRYSAQSDVIAERLGLEGFGFVRGDVADMAELLEPTDVVANVGGLYHVSNPVEVLRASYELARRYLIVQCVVSLATDDDQYFEAPAPNWDWGSRFSLVSFDRMMREQDWNIITWHANELTGNDQPSDRGSVYYLVET